MALIGTLRNKMGTWVVIFVFVAIVLFILNDLLGNNSVLFNRNDVGEIAGHSVSLEEYKAAVQEREENYFLNYNRQPGEREMETLRQQAWEILILRHAIMKQFDKVGVKVTTNEVQDMLWGKNVDANIRQAFTNPQTNQFEKDRLLNYLKTLNTPPSDPQSFGMWQQQKTRWEVFQRDLAPGRLRIKYENLLIKTSYVTTAEAEREYHVETDVAEAKFLYVPFYAVSDSIAQVTDSDLKDYYNKHSERFKTEQTRDLKYVVFAVQASAQDSMDIKNDMDKIAADFQKAEDDSAYAASVTEGQEAFGKYDVSSLPPFLDVKDLEKGKVIGPFIDGESYKIVKVSDIVADTVMSARASHILIRWEDPSEASKKAAKEKARGILKDIKAGANFAAKAREFGTDGTATRGGDLGWFAKGKMVKPFENAVFSATKPGVLNDVVETDFGYHIIDVTHEKTNTAYKLAIVERAIAPSDETTNEAYRKAEAFATDLSSEKEFTERAKQENIPVMDAKGVKPGDRSVGTVGDGRQIVMWLFNDGDKDKVSTVFDLKDQYVVAVMTGESKKGYRSFETVKDEILPDVRKQVKGRIIADKLKTLNGTLDEIAKAYGQDAVVQSTSDLKMSSNSVQAVGFDPVAVGAAFSLENGKRSQPIVGENGVLIIELQNKTIAPAIADYSSYKSTLQQGNQYRSSSGIAEAIKEYAKIEDKRYRFH
jgi:peptidyl-prolyl cis-trans isomerase D